MSKVLLIEDDSRLSSRRSSGGTSPAYYQSSGGTSPAYYQSSGGTSASILKE